MHMLRAHPEDAWWDLDGPGRDLEKPAVPGHQERDSQYCIARPTGEFQKWCPTKQVPKSVLTGICPKQAISPKCRSLPRMLPANPSLEFLPTWFQAHAFYGPVSRESLCATTMYTQFWIGAVSPFAVPRHLAPPTYASRYMWDLGCSRSAGVARSVLNVVCMFA